MYPIPSGGCVRIAIVPLMSFDLLLSAQDLFSLGWASLSELGSVSKLVILSLVRADAIPVSLTPESERRLCSNRFCLFDVV